MMSSGSNLHIIYRAFYSWWNITVWFDQIHVVANEWRSTRMSLKHPHTAAISLLRCPFLMVFHRNLDKGGCRMIYQRYGSITAKKSKIKSLWFLDIIFVKLFSSSNRFQPVHCSNTEEYARFEGLVTQEAVGEASGLWLVGGDGHGTVHR